MKSALQKAEDKVKRASDALTKAKDDLLLVRKSLKVECSCGLQHSLGELTLTITHFYVEPYGYHGDYWTESDWYFVCPSGGYKNRLLFNDYNIPYEHRYELGRGAEVTFKHLYRNAFICIFPEYSKHGVQSAHNNVWIDNHRKDFGLPC